MVAALVWSREAWRSHGAGGVVSAGGCEHGAAERTVASWARLGARWRWLGFGGTAATAEVGLDDLGSIFSSNHLFFSFLQRGAWLKYV
ncbi:hypothetical protein M0R45_030967 [Rubus argutus]|uniref:Uncharacterized protein n=1 Tax=Rubus argutus TaxID=59490 RepID=A0AAW1WC80_RUBAR